MSNKGLTRIQAALLIAVIVVAAVLSYFTVKFYISPGKIPETYVEDILGRKVAFLQKINRVVAIGPGMLRLVCYLNATDLLVGVEGSETSWGFTGRDYAMAYGESFRNLPIIGPGGPGKPPAPELILAVKPDLIIMSRTYADMYDPDRLQTETNSTVIVMDYGPAGSLDIEGFANALRILGAALNRKERAENLIKFIEGLRNDLKARTENIISRPKVYVGAVSYKGAQPFTTTQVSFPPLQLLYTPTIADKYSNKTGVYFMDFEAILKEQPEIVFIDENNLNTVKQDFDKDPGKYCQLTAFQNGKIYGTLPYNYYHTNIAVALADAYYMGKVLYPDHFGDVNPELKADEIFQAFLGKSLYEQYKEAYGGFKNLSDMFKCG
jgi:iron complex transport system substrate-binding protein